MTNWQQRLTEAFAEHSTYRPGSYVDQFLDLRTLVSKRPDELTADDVRTLTWKSQHVGDRRLLSKYLPEVMDRYVREELEAQSTTLYAALLTWANDWSHDEHGALTEALLTHWHAVSRQHGPKCLKVTTHEVAFLLLWLPDASPLDSTLRDIAQRYYRQEVEFVWDDTWDSVCWTPFVARLRVDLLGTLLTYATRGEIGWQEYHPGSDRMGWLMTALSKSGILG